MKMEKNPAVLRVRGAFVMLILCLLQPFCFMAKGSALLDVYSYGPKHTGPSAQSVFKSPELAAQTLYRAWRSRNRDRALYVSSPEVVDKLFGVRRRVMKFKGCHKREEGDFECIYEDKKNDITLAMLTVVRRRGYVIGSVSFSSEGI